MEYVFKLEIDFNCENSITDVSDILILDGKVEDRTWSYEIKVKDDDKWIDFISIFHEALVDKKEIIKKRFGDFDTTIWYYYEYDNQCNIELSHIDLMKLAEIDCAICFSCWEG